MHHYYTHSVSSVYTEKGSFPIYPCLGTRIIYERSFLLQMRNSPLAKTPPATLATIPDIINEDVAIELPQKIKPVEPKRREICSKDNPCTYVHTYFGKGIKIDTNESL